jgi:type VII secretion protein EccB
MRSRRDQVQAHTYIVGRLTSALVHGEPDAMESPLRRTGLGSFGGLLLGTLMVAAFLVSGLIWPSRGAAALTPGELVMVEQTGSRYIFANSELRPVLNWSSALMLTGGDPTMVALPAGSLNGIPHGQPVGIVGAPDTLPAASALNRGSWLVCTLSGSRRQVLVRIGVTAPGSPLPSGDAVVVQAAGEQYLVWRGQRLRLDAPWILQALGLGRAPVISTSPSWLNAVPAGPDLTPITVPGAGGPGRVLGSLHTRVGQVLAQQNVGSPTEYYLAVAGGVVPITSVQAAIVLTDPASAAAYLGAPIAPVTVSPATMARAQVVHQVLADETDAPPAPPRDDSAGSGVPCMDYPATGGVAPQLVFAEPSDGAAPSAGAPPMGMPGVSGSPQNASLVSVVPDGGALVRPQAAPGVSGNSLFLVTDAGVKFPVPSASTLLALGYRAGRAADMPAALLGLLPTGPALDLVSMRG